MAMRLIAGREQIISRTIAIAKGLHVIVHEGSGGPTPTRVHIASAPPQNGMIDIRPMKSQDSGFIKEGEFTLINARDCGEVIAMIVGDAHQARTDLRLVALDKSRPHAEDAAPKFPTPAPDLRPRVTSRLIELTPGVHLVRFSRVNRSDDTRLLISPLSMAARLFISASADGSTELTPGRAAVIELTSPTQIMLSLVSPPLSASEFSGVTIEPLAKLLDRLRRSRPRGPSPDLPAAPAVERNAAITGFRTVWPNRPLGLDLAISGYRMGGRLIGPAVMTSAWVRAPAGECLSGLKCSLIGVNRLKWEIQARLSDMAGRTVEQTGTTINFPDQMEAMSALSLEVTNPQGDRQSLTVFVERDVQKAS